MSHRALSDLKILEYSQFISGPYCAKLMADMGAEVIKVESPGVGDQTRREEPFLNDVPHPERSGLFLYLNTSKLGITLNVESKKGARIFKDLVKEADILVENNPSRVMKGLGLDWENLRQINPSLIMTSITPFGQTGPYKDYKGSDLLSCHMSGLAHGTPYGGVEDPECQPPLRPGGRQAHFAAGITASAATLCAVLGRAATGTGQQVDVSELESMVTFVKAEVASYGYDFNGAYQHQKDRGGAGVPLRASTRFWPCKDGYFSLQTTEEYQWQAFVKTMGDPQWARDERFKDNASRGENFETLRPLVLEWTMQHTMDEIYHWGQANRAPVFRLNTVGDLLEEKQFAARGFFVDIQHPATGSLRYPGTPYQFSKTPWQIERPAPLLGQHNEEVYCRRLGYSREDLVRLRQAGVI